MQEETVYSEPSDAYRSLVEKAVQLQRQARGGSEATRQNHIRDPAE